MSPLVYTVLAAVVVAFVVWRFAARRSKRPERIIRPERRRSARIVPPAHKPAELQIIGQDFLEIPEVRDISDDGLAISVPHKFNGHKPTQEVDLLLTLHGEGTVKARGAIRHVSYTRSDTATFGVELVAIDEDDRGKIRRYLDEIAQAKADRETSDEPEHAGAPPRRPPK